MSGRLASVLYPNGQTSAYAYYPNSQDHRLQTIHHQYPGGATLSKFDYTYDAAGNILTWQQQPDSDPPVVWVYGYDRADQLTRAVKQTTGGAPTVLKRYAYGYDPAGNRTFEQIDDAMTGWTHDSLNRLATQEGGGFLRFAGTVSEPATVTLSGTPATVTAANTFAAAVPVAPGTPRVTVTATDPNGNTAMATYEVDVTANEKTFTYDENGNLASDGARLFEWDARNQLVAVTAGNMRDEYGYNGLRQRTTAAQLTNGVSQSVEMAVWCDGQQCERRTPAVSPTISLRQGLYDESGSQYFLKDHLGSPRQVTSSSGAPISGADFDPFGRRHAQPAANRVGASFGGLFEMEDSGLQFATHRVYEPNLGRWLSEDPIGMIDNANLYAYVNNGPLTYRDPTGLAGISTGDIAGVLPGVCELTAARDLLSSYRAMIAANHIDSDQYFHCVGSCNAARRGYCGWYVSYVITELREFVDREYKGDPVMACHADREANRYGRRRRISTCRIVCSRFRPPTMDQRW